MALRRRAARFAGRTPELVVRGVSGDSAGDELRVEGLQPGDPIVAVLNLADGSSQSVAGAGVEHVTLDDDTSGDNLVVLFWSAGIGNRSSS